MIYPQFDGLDLFMKYLHGVAHVAGWEPYDLRYLPSFSRGGSVLHTDFAQHLVRTDTGSSVDDIDHDISELDDLDHRLPQDLL